MATYRPHVRRRFAARTRRAVRSAARLICALYWLAVISPLAALKRAAPALIKVTLLDNQLQSSIATHGTAVVYQSLPAKEKLTADICQPDWFLLQPLSERAFSVSRPELLRRPCGATLKAIAHEFELQGLRVKELHLNLGRSTIVHFFP